MTNADGSTKIPEHMVQATNTAECMRQWKHKWQWVWVNDKMTDTLRCTTCGQQRDSKDTGQ